MKILPQRKIKYIYIFISIFFLTMVLVASAKAASAVNPTDRVHCLVPVPNKPGCVGINKLSDIKYREQAKCFMIDRNAKDCGVFLSILPKDLSSGVGVKYKDDIKHLDCKSEASRNNPECANYCYNNPGSSKSACVDCNSLTASEKANYSYCQDPREAKYCDAIADDNNGSSWGKTLGGVINVHGTCLNGYHEDASLGAPTRDCSATGQWETHRVVCRPNTCNNSELNKNNEVANVVFVNNGGTTDYKQKQVQACNIGYNGTITATCQADGTWKYEGSCILVTCANSALNYSNVTFDKAGTTDYSKTQVKSCNTNYSGSVTATCQASGLWSYSGGCTIKTCNRASPLGGYNAAASSGTINAGTSIAFGCNSGYTGSVTMACNNGAWQYSSGSCLRQCNRASPPSGYNVASSSGLTNSGSTVTFGCSGGYTGSVAFYCNNGSWSRSSGSCRAYYSCSNFSYSGPSRDCAIKVALTGHGGYWRSCSYSYGSLGHGQSVSIGGSVQRLTWGANHCSPSCPNITISCNDGSWQRSGDGVVQGGGCQHC